MHGVITRHLRHFFEPSGKICVGREVVQVGVLSAKLRNLRTGGKIRYRGVVAKQIIGARQIVLIEHLHGAGNRMP